MPTGRVLPLLPPSLRPWLYVSDEISSLEVDSIVGGDGFNLKFCKLQFQGGKKTTVGLVYKSPNISENRELNFLRTLQSIKDKHIVYFGDFNYPNINWNSLEADRKGSKFLDMIQNNFLIQHIDFRTRGENILDLLFSSEENIIENARTNLEN